MSLSYLFFEKKKKVILGLNEQPKEEIRIEEVYCDLSNECLIE